MILLLIYSAFIGLGLPDALLGSAWPVMRPQFGVSPSFAGWVSMIISGGTIFSSLSAARMLKRFGAGRVTAASVALTALALSGFAAAPSAAWLFPAAIPLGLGAGAVDAVLNAFVAEHYAARHMNWLHAFWGLGALAGPILLAGFLAQGGVWRSGYFCVATLQAALAACLFLSLPLWGKVPRRLPAGPAPAPGGGPPLLRRLRIPGVGTASLVFFCYCGVEATLGLWGASFLVKAKGADPVSAARWVAGFYGGIMAGRVLTGFVSHRFANERLIRWGCAGMLAGVLLLFLPYPIAPIGLALAGLGCAPVFPCMLHETPARFGASDNQGIMGVQMAAAYVGTTALPPAFGFLAAGASIGSLPFFLAAYAAAVFAGAEALRRRKGREGALQKDQGP